MADDFDYEPDFDAMLRDEEEMAGHDAPYDEEQLPEDDAQFGHGQAAAGAAAGTQQQTQAFHGGYHGECAQGER